MAIWVKDVQNDLLVDLMKALDPRERQRMIEADKRVIDPLAARKLVEFIEKRH